MVQCINLDFDFYQMPGCLFGGAQRGDDAAGQGDVVVLDENGIVEAETMIGTAPATNRVFLRKAQAGRGFARAGDARFGVGDGIGNAASCGGDAGKRAEEIKRDTLAG